MPSKRDRTSEAHPKSDQWIDANRTAGASLNRTELLRALAGSLLRMPLFHVWVPRGFGL